MSALHVGIDAGARGIYVARSRLGRRGPRIVGCEAIARDPRVSQEEQIAAVVPVREFREDQFLLFGTRKGVVKKSELSAYGNVRNVGLNAINIRDDDELIEVQITSGDDEIILASRGGMAIRFSEGDVRTMGRTAGGVRGLKLKGDDIVVGMVVVRPESTLLVVSERGMGKRTEVDAYRHQKRGGSGVIIDPWIGSGIARVGGPGGWPSRSSSP